MKSNYFHPISIYEIKLYLMKTVRKRILISYNFLLKGLIAILGFVPSCIPGTEYGTPSAKFIVNGKVTSAATNLPVENIRVIMQGDTSFTDAGGMYQVIDKYGFPTSQTFPVSFQDVDGDTNIKFNDLDTIVEFKDPKFTGGDGDWYHGETSATFNVKLKPAK